VILLQNARCNRGIDVMHWIVNKSLPFDVFLDSRQHLEQQGVEPVALAHSEGETFRNQKGKGGFVEKAVRRAGTIELQKTEQIVLFGKGLPFLTTLADDC